MFSDGIIGGPLHDYQLLHAAPPSTTKRRSTMHEVNKKSSSIEGNAFVPFVSLLSNLQSLTPSAPEAILVKRNIKLHFIKTLCGLFS